MKITKKIRIYKVFLRKLMLLGVLLSSHNLLAAEPQTYELKGIVLDAQSNRPVSAARIQVVNDKASAVTDSTGAFVVKVSSMAAMIEIRAFGYNVKQVGVQGRSVMRIALYPDYFQNTYHSLETFQGKGLNISQPSSYKSAEIDFASDVFTLDEALQRSIGADARIVTRSGNAGMGAVMFLRGLNSLNINAQPLIVVDGVPRDMLRELNSIHQGFYSNPLLNIELSDVESVTVMKDGTSIYGSSASNGVVFVKTRRASEMATRIQLNITSGLATAPRELPLLNASQYLTYASELLGTSGLSQSDIEQLPFINSDPTRSNYKMYHNNTHWLNEIYRKGVTQNYAINVRGGDEKALYYFALGYTNNTGVVKNNDFGRYNMRLNADINLSPKMKLGANIGFSRIDRQLIDDGVNEISSPRWISQIKSPFLSPNTYTALGEKTSEYAYVDIFNIGNPEAIIDFSINTLKQSYFNLSIKPEYHFSPNWVLSNQFDYQIDKTNEDYYRPYLFAAPVYTQGVGYSHNARRSQVMRLSSLFNNLQLQYSKNFEKTHQLNAMAGMRYLYRYYESDYAEGHNSLSNSSINLMGGFNNIRTDGVNVEQKKLSYYANGLYAFDNRYFVDVAMSVDGSSRFGLQAKSGFALFGQRWAVFPSLNVAWLLSNEAFMNHVSWVNMLKLRAGYGLTGNDDIPDYQTNAYFASVALKGVSNGLVLSSLANKKIQWETSLRANLGLDGAFFNDRINVGLDVYHSSTNHLLVMKDYPEITGLGKYWDNDGRLSNRGFELSLNAKILHLKQLGWEATLTAGHYKNKIEALNNGSFTTQVLGGEVLSGVGQAAGVFYGYKTKGVFATEAQAQAANLKIADGQGGYKYFGAGDVIFDDYDSNGIIDKKDRQIIGDPNPDVYGSFMNKFTFGDFSLSALFTYSYGNEVYNYQRSLLESGSSFNNQSLALLGRWATEGHVTNQPRAVYGDPMGNARFSDRWIEDGSYIRLKSVTLSYNVPLKVDFIQGLNLWMSANNLLTWSNYLGNDPEFSAGNSVLFQGVDAGLLPLSRNYFIGLKVNL